jgi:hypothetical protein
MPLKKEKPTARSSTFHFARTSIIKPASFSSIGEFQNPTKAFSEMIYCKDLL